MSLCSNIKILSQLGKLKFIPFPQDAIEAVFSKVNLGARYEIGIVAESAAGVSLRSTVSGNVDDAASTHIPYVITITFTCYTYDY